MVKTKRLKGAALRRYVAKQEAKGWFARWRARCDAIEAAMASRTPLQTAYLSQRRYFGEPAIWALRNAKDLMARRLPGGGYAPDPFAVIRREVA